MTFALRPYQTTAIDLCRDAFRSGGKRVVLLLPTGGGKTLVGCHVARSAVEKGRRVLWLAHRRELVDQSCLTIEASGLRCGSVSASSVYPYRPDAPVQVASIQTLLARNLRPEAGLIVWDEAHHCAKVAEQWSSLLESYPDVPVLGLTATPERGDGAGLAPLFDTLVVGATIPQLTELGFLVPCDVIRPDRKLASGEIAQDPVDAYMEHGAGRQGFLFARYVEEAEEYARQLVLRGVQARAVHADTRDDVRRESVQGFRDGRVRVLCNVYVFTEGTDLPAAAICILARGAGTPGIMLQMVGRVLRLSPGKSRATLVDLAGVTHQLGLPGDPRLWSLHGKACVLSDAAKACPRCGANVVEFPCDACGFEPDGDRLDTVVTGEPLQYASKRAEGDEQRWETILRWARVCVESGYKPGWLAHKYRAVYGASPPDGWTFKALAYVRGDRAVGA